MGQSPFAPGRSGHCHRDGNVWSHGRGWNGMRLFLRAQSKAKQTTITRIYSAYFGHSKIQATFCPEAVNLRLRRSDVAERGAHNRYFKRQKREWEYFDHFIPAFCHGGPRGVFVAPRSRGDRRINAPPPSRRSVGPIRTGHGAHRSSSGSTQGPGRSVAAAGPRRWFPIGRLQYTDPTCWFPWPLDDHWVAAA